MSKPAHVLMTKVHLKPVDERAHESVNIEQGTKVQGHVDLDTIKVGEPVWMTVTKTFNGERWDWFHTSRVENIFYRPDGSIEAIETLNSRYTIEILKQ
jgi:hypothetical protein